MSAERPDVASQRLGAFAEFPAVLRELGADPATLFAGTGLDPEALTPDTRAPLGVVLDIVDRAAAETDCPHIGLLTGLRFTLRHHGPIGRLMRTAPTLRDALADFIAWQHGYSSAAIVYLVHMGDDEALGFGVHARSRVVSHHLWDFVAAVSVRMVSELTNAGAAPLEIHLARRAPEKAALHARILKAPVLFNRPLNCVLFGRAAMRAPLATHDPVARRALMAQMETQVVAAAGHAGQVRRAIRRALLEETPRMPEIAHDLAIHPRTLRRRLSDEGTSFDELLDDVRRTVARELLELTDLPLADVADALAFASPGVFSDWFRRVFGVQPSLWPRRAAREAANT